MAQSKVFQPNINMWKFLGMWPENTSSKYYKYYCYIFVTITSVIFWILFTLSIIFTPINLEMIIAQAMFYFTEVAGISKIGMIIIKRNDIDKLFKILDCEEFQGDEDIPKEIVNNNLNYYGRYWKACGVLYYWGSFFLLFVPVFLYLLGIAELELPLCQYYFLSEYIRNKYFNYIFVYQFCCIFVIINSNLATDTFICGLIMMAVTQFKVLNWKMSNLMIRLAEDAQTFENKETFLKERLCKNLKHYDLVLKYCEDMQNILSGAIFAQFGTGAATLCVTMCAFLRPMGSQDFMFLFCYIGVMTLEIFLPGLLGAQLTRESQNLVYASYCSDWISRPEAFKRSLRLMVERANKPIVITGFKMFPLSLETFTSIIKMAYSFFTLLKNVQEK